MKTSCFFHLGSDLLDSQQAGGGKTSQTFGAASGDVAFRFPGKRELYGCSFHLNAFLAPWVGGARPTWLVLIGWQNLGAGVKPQLLLFLLWFWT